MKTFQNFLNSCNNILGKFFPYLVGMAVGMLVISCRIPAIIREYNDYSNKEISVEVRTPSISYLEENPLYNNKLKNIEDHVCNKENEIK